MDSFIKPLKIIISDILFFSFIDKTMDISVEADENLKISNNSNCSPETEDFLYSRNSQRNLFDLIEKIYLFSLSLLA